ncbi:DUF1674-domain-containing protein [Hypomontagnella monticulosa]|nr:DUF1674-domain-containing protein [Hypomontagnella monticulosa]
MASRLARLARLTRPFAIQSSLQPQHPIRYASSSSSRGTPNPFESMPSPPRLPPDQQAEFERLQRTANTQEGFNPTSTPDFSSSSSTSSTAAVADGKAPAIEDELSSIPLRKGAPPEFEGEVNPKTGEVGGPKNEPLRWGPGGDYSFNGRVTDF